MNVMLIPTLVTPMAKEWALDPITIGYLLSTGYLGMFVGALSFGRLADIIGRKKVLVNVLFLEAIFTALCGLAEEKNQFCNSVITVCHDDIFKQYCRN
jgi:MFS family permease